MGEVWGIRRRGPVILISSPQVPERSDRRERQQQPRDARRRRLGNAPAARSPTQTRAGNDAVKKVAATGSFWTISPAARGRQAHHPEQSATWSEVTARQHTIQRERYDPAGSPTTIAAGDAGAAGDAAGDAGVGADAEEVSRAEMAAETMTTTTTTATTITTTPTTGRAGEARRRPAARLLRARRVVN